MSALKLSTRLLAVPGATEQYMKCPYFHNIITSIMQYEREGQDGVEALGRILVGMSVAREESVTAAVHAASRALSPDTPIMQPIEFIEAQERAVRRDSQR